LSDAIVPPVANNNSFLFSIIPPIFLCMSIRDSYHECNLFYTSFQLEKDSSQPTNDIQLVA
jgi:hypothetical protein